jgi:aspartate aminotransferase, mitochondrial
MAMTSSPWSQFDMAPVDPIVGLNEIYSKDDFPSKVIVGVGAYRDDLGKPYVLPCVREAEQILMDKNLDMEYTGIVSKEENRHKVNLMFSVQICSTPKICFLLSY